MDEIKEPIAEGQEGVNNTAEEIAAAPVVDAPVEEQKPPVVESPVDEAPKTEAAPVVDTPEVEAAPVKPFPRRHFDSMG